MGTIYTLHGFLGLPSDFAHFHSIHKFKHVNLFENKPKDLNSFAHEFNNKVTKEKSSPNYLMGYSLGGRLALHALIENKNLWDGAIIISANLGLYSSEEKQKRINQDEELAYKFKNNDWNEVMKEWDGQSAFQNSFNFMREEKNYNKEHLAAALQNWSLGKQEDLTWQIAQLPHKIFWVIGDLDPKIDYLNRLSFKNSHSKVYRIKNAGHRAPWQQPELFQDILNLWNNYTERNWKIGF